MRRGRLVQTVVATALVATLSSCGCNGPSEDPGAETPCWKGPTSAEKWPPTCWRPYANDSPFNTPIRENPQTLSNSGQIVDRILGKVDPIPAIPQGLRVGNIEAPQSGHGGEPTYWLDTGVAENTYTVKCGEFGVCELNDKQVRIPMAA